MNNLKKEIFKIEKDYFMFSDLRKISNLSDESLRVVVSRMIKSGEIVNLAKGYYSLPETVVDLPKVAVEIYAPSYLSFKWVLGQTGILSQKAHNLTLATQKRAKKISFGETMFFYHHIRPDLFFGYKIKNGYLMADSEKAFLDLAYLSLNGYAKFDPEDMNLDLLNKKKIKDYLKKFQSKGLKKLIGNMR